MRQLGGWGRTALQEREGGQPLAPRRNMGPALLALLALLGVALFSSIHGAVAIPTITTLQILVRKMLPEMGLVEPSWPRSYEAVILQIRLPRIVLAGLVGASLAVAGATYQGLFRNPLADPYLIGVAAGAGLGATIAIILPLSPIFYSYGIVQVLAFLGAVLTVFLVYLLSRVGRTTPVTTLLLAGVALGAFASAITSFLMYLHGDKLLTIYSWLLGGFSMGNWQQVLTTVPYALVSLGVIQLYARPLNVMQLGEEEAGQLGIDVERVKLVLVSAATLATAAAVSVSGLIGFVGLIVPHTVRLLWGPDYRFLVPMTILLGAAFTILADTLARTLLAPIEIPVGVISAFCGAPFFLYLLRQRKRAIF